MQASSSGSTTSAAATAAASCHQDTEGSRTSKPPNAAITARVAFRTPNRRTAAAGTVSSASAGDAQRATSAAGSTPAS
jgi:hypothetical protein